MPGRYSLHDLDAEDLPEAVVKALKAKERDDEPTQVTKLLDDLRECADETKSSFRKAGEAADRVSRMTMETSKSYPRLVAVLSKAEFELPSEEVAE